MSTRKMITERLKRSETVPEVELSLCHWRQGRVGAWGYQLTYKDHKKEEIGLCTDCDGCDYKPQITAARKAVDLLKKKCRIAIDAIWYPLDVALEWEFNEHRRFHEDEYNLLADLEFVPGWKDLVKAVSAHDFYFVDAPKYFWLHTNPFSEKVRQAGIAYIRTLPLLERMQFRC